MERCGDQDLSLNKDDENPRNIKFGAIDTSTMCFWKSLSGPSLESETCDQMLREQRKLILEEGAPTMYSCPCDSR